MNKFDIKQNLSISIYSYGYSAGFIHDTRFDAKKVQNIDATSIVNIAHEMNVGGVEIPVDKFFPEPESDGLWDYIQYLKDQNLRLIMDLENFSSSYLYKLRPFLSSLDYPFIRVKVSNFYGGNRYKYPKFETDKSYFITNLKDVCCLLDEYNVKILIENHQDIVVADLIEIIEMFGDERVGVNWDIGNSFPACETPESFISKLGHYIGNVHLKDYRLFSSEDGYIMSRCALGDGVVEFDSILNKLRSFGIIPLTIELGALNSRVADINNPLYWEKITGISDNDKKYFIDYITSNTLKGNNWKSAWELGYSPRDIAAIETLEMKKSIIYIYNILQSLNLK